MAKFGVQAHNSSHSTTTTLKTSKTSRPARNERLVSAKGRPKRRAAATHFFKYQLASNPSRVEENDLKKALQESLKEQSIKKHSTKNIISSTNSSDVSRSNNSSSSSESVGSFLINASQKRTRSATTPTNNSSSSSNNVNLPVNNNKRAKLRVSNGHQDNKCDASHSVIIIDSPTKTLPHINMAIKTYSKNQTNISTNNTSIVETQFGNHVSLKSSTPKSKIEANLLTKDKESQMKNLSSTYVSRSTQTSKCIAKANSLISLNKSAQDASAVKETPSAAANTTNTNLTANNNPDSEAFSTPIQDNFLKFKRESKNYAYVKMTALKVSTSKSPSSNSKSSQAKKTSPNGILHNKSTNNKDSSRVKPKASNNCLNGANSSTLDHTNSRKQTPNVSLSTDNAKATLKYTEKQNSKSDLGNNNRKSPANNSPRNTPQNRKATPGNDNLTLDTTKNQALQTVVRESIQTNQNSDIHVGDFGDLSTPLIRSLDNAPSLSTSKNQNQASVKVTKKRTSQGSWSLIGIPEEKVIYLRDDEPPKRLICYPAIKHVEGDVIQVKDSVLLRSGARKTDLPYIAKVCSLWEDAESGSVMMSLFWYYRPEHTEEGRKPHHLIDEIFASRHRDVDSVECIEDKCYVLTFNEYCRYRKRCKMEQVNTTWSLTDVIIPMLSESYPRRNRIPDGDVNPELVFCCRQIYDSRMKRLVKNPLINPKYGHI